MPTYLQRIVFCDFDGTITAVETFAGMLKEFAPTLSERIMPQLYDRTLTLRDGVRQLLESIASTKYPEILDYAANKPIRPGLAELLDFLSTQSVPFVVVSGGVREMVENVLKREGLLERVSAIAAVDIDRKGEYLQVFSEFEADEELVSKVKVMSAYPAEETVAIGDSVTDINMALNADLVFARDRLIDYLEAEGKPYLRWHDFFDIRDSLKQHWQLEDS